MATNESLSHTETIDNKRYYHIQDNKGERHLLPSVTTVLGAMGDKTTLENWRKRIGEAEADRISKFSANRGTCMHQKLEYWFTSDIADKKERLKSVNEKMEMFIAENGYTQEELKVGNSLFNSLYICGFFEKVDSIIEMENTLWSLSNGGYAGRVDCIYKDKCGKKVLLDFKTSKKKKKAEWLTSYYMQLSAYYFAYYEMYGIALDRAELWIAVENDTPQLIEVSVDELKIWIKYFRDFVKKYHQQYDYLVTQASQDLPINNDDLYKEILESLGEHLKKYAKYDRPELAFVIENISEYVFKSCLISYLIWKDASVVEEPVLTYRERDKLNRAHTDFVLRAIYKDGAEEIYQVDAKQVIYNENGEGAIKLTTSTFNTKNNIYLLVNNANVYNNFANAPREFDKAHLLLFNLSEIRDTNLAKPAQAEGRDKEHIRIPVERLILKSPPVTVFYGYYGHTAFESPLGNDRHSTNDACAIDRCIHKNLDKKMYALDVNRSEKQKLEDLKIFIMDLVKLIQKMNINKEIIDSFLESCGLKNKTNT